MYHRAIPALLGLLLLAGCGGGSSSAIRGLPVPCPGLSLVADAADLTRYRPGGPQDLTGMVADARITGVNNGECERGRGGRTIRVTFNVGLRADRGPASDGREVEVPWFVAVTEKSTGRILDKQVYIQVFSFPANATRTGGDSQPVVLELPVGETRRAPDYQVLVGFQLTPEELALNRRRGPR